MNRSFKLSGVSVAKKIKDDVKNQINFYKELRNPKLAVLLCNNDNSSRVYVKKKQEACHYCGIESVVVECHPDESFYHIERFNENNHIDGILVQLPIQVENIGLLFEFINPAKDVDVLNPLNLGRLLQGNSLFIPCTPQAVVELLSYYNIDIIGKKICIINRSNIVGKPLFSFLIQDRQDANATVFMCHDRTSPEIIKDVMKISDIVVVAVGIPGFITPNMVTENMIIIDVGINKVNNNIVGDVDREVCNIVKAYTPVPGGIGPVTVACLMKNTYLAWKMNMKLD